jgi:hypothetical protein
VHSKRAPRHRPVRPRPCEKHPGPGEQHQGAAARPLLCHPQSVARDRLSEWMVTVQRRRVTANGPLIPTGDGERALVTVQRRRADFAIRAALAISDAPLGGLWAKRAEPQIILKTDKRNLVFELGAGGNSSSSQAVGMRTGSSARRQARSRSRTAAGRWPHLPAGSRQNQPVEHYLPTE